MDEREQSGTGGAPVDASGGPAYDPTPNVLALVDAAVKRLDDLRAAEMRRMDDLHNAEFRRIDQISSIRSYYSELLAVAEAKRIDAIRAVDVNAVAVAAERSTQQANVLANQVAASADALRSLVASTATANSQAQATLTQQLNDRIATLEKSSYEGKGRQSFADPALAELVVEMRRVASAQTQSTGKSEGFSTSWAVLIGVAGLLAAVFGGGFLNKKDPQVVYVPTPAATVVSPQK